jgi:hypothetical protein
MDKTESVFRTLLPCAVVATLVGLAGCDDDTDGEPETVDVTGSWELVATRTSDTCELPSGDPETEIVYLEDTSTGFSVTVFSGHWGDGELTGRTITFLGSETTEDLGCLASLTTEGTGELSGNQIVGSLVTTVRFDPDSCTGYSECEIRSDFVMTKMEESPCLDRAQFGDPGESSYVLPFPPGASYEVYQSYCCPTSGHRDQLAYDFTMPIGDAVVAARRGVVRDLREDSPDDGQGVGEHNYVLIEHDDGTAAFYAHLMQQSVTAEEGDTLAAGEQFAQSGNSGYSEEPHLHFGVYRDYPTVEGEDVPVNFRNAIGPLDERGGLIRGEIYTAGSY